MATCLVSNSWQVDFILPLKTSGKVLARINGAVGHPDMDIRKAVLHDSIERNLSQVYRGLPGMHPAVRGVYQGNGDRGER
jgi:hypothetical protein